MDEPTSGLDPGLDRKMLLLLRKLADTGRANPRRQTPPLQADRERHCLRDPPIACALVG
jgi:hypothetical protein